MDTFEFFWLIIGNIIDFFFNFDISDGLSLGYLFTTFIIVIILINLMNKNKDENDEEG